MALLLTWQTDVPTIRRMFFKGCHNICFLPCPVELPLCSKTYWGWMVQSPQLLSLEQKTALKLLTMVYMNMLIFVWPQLLSLSIVLSYCCSGKYFSIRQSETSYFFFSAFFFKCRMEIVIRCVIFPALLLTVPSCLFCKRTRSLLGFCLFFLYHKPILECETFC